MRAILAALLLTSVSLSGAVFNVRDYGAKGDGVALDSPAINAAIAAAAGQGGGTVVLPAGTYLSFSIRLQSRITLQLDKGATLLAATPAEGLGAYDPPEPNDWGDKLQYQDFGHSHWHNSLIWGEDLEQIAITGEGLIHGQGLVRNAGYGRPGATGPNGTVTPGAAPAAPIVAPAGPAASGGQAGPPLSPVGQGNKAIGLKNCHDVTLRGFSILQGGHFALLATGVSRLVIEHLTVDTNRDGFDIDACQHVRIENCRVNSPNDDAIVLKTSFALGEVRPTRNVKINQCTVSGFDVGTLLDGTRQRTQVLAPDRDGPTGRIKIGTESNGDFQRIDITNCTFIRSRGLAIESVDGGAIEDVVVSGLEMREINNTPIFVRLGNRARGPAGTRVGSIRNVSIGNVRVTDSDARYAAVLVSGLPGHPIYDLIVGPIQVESRGGLTPEIVARQPADLVNPFFLRGSEPGLTGPRDPLAVPLREKAYPEPSMFGLIPASVVYARHVRTLQLNGFTVTFTAPDTRPRFVFDDVDLALLTHLDVPPLPGSTMVLRAVKHFSLDHCTGLTDVRHEAVDSLQF